MKTQKTVREMRYGSAVTMHDVNFALMPPQDVTDENGSSFWSTHWNFPLTAGDENKGISWQTSLKRNQRIPSWWVDEHEVTFRSLDHLPAFFWVDISTISLSEYRTVQNLLQKAIGLRAQHTNGYTCENQSILQDYKGERIAQWMTLQAERIDIKSFVYNYR